MQQQAPPPPHQQQQQQQLLPSKDDSAHWLHNKLHSTTHLWSFSSTVVSQYTEEKLQSIRDCFSTLDSLVKIKFFLTLFHIPKRNLDKEIIDDTLATCLDQWVLSIATFVSSFWQTQSLNTELDFELESFREAYDDLLKTFNDCVDNDEGCERVKFLLPIECDYLNRTARQYILPVSNQDQKTAVDTAGSLLSLTSSSKLADFGASSSSVNDILLNLLNSDNQCPSVLNDYGANLDSIAGNANSNAKKHFNLVKTSKSISIIDDLKYRASHYSKSKTTKQLINTGSAGLSLGFGDVNDGHSSTSSSSSSSLLSSAPGNALNSNSSKSTLPFMNRFMPSKKIESMTAFNSNNLNNSDSYGSKHFSNTTNSSSSSSFFKRTVVAQSYSTTITGKSSVIKRDVGIKLLEPQEQSASPKEAKRKRKEQEKETLKKFKQEQKIAEKLAKTNQEKTSTSKEENASADGTNKEFATEALTETVSKLTEPTEKGTKEHDSTTTLTATTSTEEPIPKSEPLKHSPTTLLHHEPSLKDFQTSNENLVPNSLHNINNNNNNDPNSAGLISSMIENKKFSPTAPPRFPIVNHNLQLPLSSGLPPPLPQFTSSILNQQNAPLVANLSDMFHSMNAQQISTSAAHLDPTKMSQFYRNNNTNQNNTFANTLTSPLLINNSDNLNNINNNSGQLNSPQLDESPLANKNPRTIINLNNNNNNNIVSNNINNEMNSVTNQNTSSSFSNNAPAQANNQQEVKRQQPSLSLTREQMLQAQEMFNNSNKLTRPEKALILGFIAGSRDNPRPEHGPVISIKLNEAEEFVTASNGQQHKVLGELYFQMNYDTDKQQCRAIFFIVETTNGKHLCMSQSDEQFKGIIENSELKLLKNLINLLSEPPQQHGVKTSDELEKYISRISASNHHNNTVDGPPPIRPRNLKDYDENDDEDIVVVDSENDLEKAESQSENENDDHDDDDDVEYGQNRVLSSLANTVAATLINSNAREKSTSETETEENTIEIGMLEKFKEHYVREYNLSKHKYGKYFEMILNLILKKRLCSRNWLTTCNSNRNLYFILYCLRILLRDFNFQKQFFNVENSFYSLSKLFNKYVNRYSSLHNQILLHSHILDQLLGVLTKVIMSDALIEMNRNLSDGRVGSGNQTNCSSMGKKIIDTIFELKMHATLMQLIEISDELCLVHASLNILIHLASIDVLNRPKLANDLDIIDELLRILQEYDEDSKKLASKLLCFLCSEEKIKREVTNLDGVQILLSLLHNHNNLDILWNVIWSLVQICSYEDNKREIRLLGGIPVILSILCDKNLDSQLLDVQTNESNHSQNGSTPKRSHEKTDYHHKSQKMRLQILSASCALVSELAFNETNSYHIVNTNGVYLIASKLLIMQKEPHIERNKDIERVHCNVWRALRLLFSFERHRSLIKKLIPFTIFTTFVDIGNFKTELKLYQPLVDQFYKLTNDEIESMKTQLKICNQTQTPKNYVNEYAVYEIIGSGGFGRVHKVKKKNSNYFLAMKEVNTHHLTTFKDISLGEIVNEVSIIRNNLKHPNIVKYLKTFKENDSLYIVMELIDGTPLSQHFVTLKEKNEQWSEDKIWNLFIQIVLALKYLHKEKNIVHRDLTSNNIMLSENDKITITDFGLAKLKQTDCSKMLSVVGTMYYSCPEIIKNEPYNEKADIWALGCILYEMCCLDPPFCTPNMLALATKITQGDYDHERLYRNSYSELVGSVVRNCLIIEPSRRPDIVGVAALIAEKILTYTDSIRYKSINLEKKLEKEKNKTQRFFCNKQDLNTYNANYTNSTSSMKEADDVTGSQFITQNFFMSNSTTNSSSTNISTNVSPATSKNSNLQAAPRQAVNGDQQRRLKANERSISLSFNKENDSMNALGSALTPDSNKVINYASSPVSPSPNAKLPPNPKTKLIMKNYQNKQRQQELAAAQLQHLNQPPSHAVDLTSAAEQPSNVKMNASVTSLNQDIQGKESSTNQSSGSNATNKIQRSSSSSVLDKRPSQSKKSRPNSANVSSLPVYKKLRPIEDPIIQILEQIHKLLFITHLPPSGKKNFKRKLVDRYKRSLFSNKRSPSQIKSELMKLIKNSTDLIDMEMIGLKSVQYLGFSGCNSMSSNNNITNSQRIINAAATAAASSGSTTNLNKLQSQISIANDSCLVDLETIINQNGITYEQFQSIIEELLVENNYHMEHLRHLK